MVILATKSLHPIVVFVVVVVIGLVGYLRLCCIKLNFEVCMFFPLISKLTGPWSYVASFVEWRLY